MAPSRRTACTRCAHVARGTRTRLRRQHPLRAVCSAAQRAPGLLRGVGGKLHHPACSPHTPPGAPPAHHTHHIAPCRPLRIRPLRCVRAPRWAGGARVEQQPHGGSLRALHPPLQGAHTAPVAAAHARPRTQQQIHPRCRPATRAARRRGRRRGRTKILGQSQHQAWRPRLVRLICHDPRVRTQLPRQRQRPAACASNRYTLRHRERHLERPEV
jgi:hypothetical protein